MKFQVYCGLAVGALCLAAFLTNRETNPTNVSEAEQPAQREVGAPKARARFVDPKGPQAQLKIGGPSPACARRWKSFTAVNLKKLPKIDARFLSGLKLSGCVLPGASEAIAANCTPEKVSAFGGSLACLHSLTTYQKLALRELYRNQPLESISSEAALAALAEEQGEVGNSERIEKLAARMLELNPRNALAADLLLRAKYKAWKASGRAAKEEAELELAARKLESLEEGRETLRELELAKVQERGDLPMMRKLAADSLAQDPGSSTGNYYLAWASYLEGDVEEAKTRLRGILSTRQYDSRARYTLDQLESADRNSDAAVFFEEPLMAAPNPGSL